MVAILLIEDEAAIADTVLYALKTEGFHPIWCATGQTGLYALHKDSPALVILDIGLPDMNGFDVCREIRRLSTAPIIFLTARNEEIDRIVGLELGADDYMSKPFSPRELTARVRAILRRTASTPVAATDDNRQPASAFTVDEAACSIRYHNVELSLSRYEYRLLNYLLARPKRVFSREELLERVWENPEHSLDRTVDTHIKTLRAKLRAVHAEADPIRTHRGFGYSLSETE